MSCQMLTQKLKQEVLTEELKLLNPNLTVDTSVTFMKQITGVTISTIAYVRGMFPESAFVTKKLEGTKCWLLKGNEDIPGTLSLIQWMKGAFEAVRLHILKRMILVIEPEDGCETLETYTLNFTYNFEAISFQLMSESSGKESLIKTAVPSDNIKKAVQQMFINVLMSTGDFQPLPKNCKMGVRLEFNDNVPESYELPEYFQAAESLDLNFPSEAQSLKLANVQSKFIGLNLRTKSIFNQPQMNKNYPGDDIEDEVPSSQPDANYLNVSLTDRATAPAMVVGEPKNIAETMATIDLNEKEIQCVCESNNDTNSLIMCSSCQKFQHKACYKLLDDQENANHICVNCHEPNSNRICSDPDLISNQNRKFEALYRRALIVCLRSAKVSISTFMNQLSVTRQLAQKIFGQLDKDGFFHQASGKGYIRLVKTEYLRENAFNMYFTTQSRMEVEDIFDLQDYSKVDAIGRKRTRDVADDLIGYQQKRLKYASNRTKSNIQPFL